jgi:ABC-type glycerol-3-phosphate transport system substrate-binding protein
VATGVDPNLPVEFALRNAAVDLSQFPEFKAVERRFQKGALVPFQWRGGTYAIPENSDFNMLFYRKDILDALGLKPPQTWDEVYAMIPELHRHGLDFFYPAPGNELTGPSNLASVKSTTDPGFSAFLFQHGGKYYTEDGLRSALGTEQALQAFQRWTGLYTSYKLSRNANFFNRFRTGEMPVGVANYLMYMQLSTAAPELTGWWAMAPMPGVRRPDGTIDRSNSATAQTAMIFKQSQKQQEAWQFLNWWTATETQVRFAVELEALMGVEARWPTANVEALRQLPWPQQDIEAVMEQWAHLEQVPVVPGGYLTARHVVNAWNKVVLSGTPVREALEDAVKDIDRELRKKQEEFGIQPGKEGAR